MKTSLITNGNSLQIQRQLDQSTRGYGLAAEKLASGLRINHAADDVAGLAVVTGLQNNSRLLAQGVRNMNDGISMLNIADGALESLSDLVSRQQELAEQAANGTYTAAQRRALQLEATACTDEFNRIVDTTQFNGMKLFDGKQTFALQAGASGTDGINILIGSKLGRVVGDGTFSAWCSSTLPSPLMSGAAGDFNGDGNVDLLGQSNSNGWAGVFLGNGNGTFAQSASLGVTNFAQNNYSAALIRDVNGDGKADALVLDSDSAVPDSTVHIFIGNGNGTFLASRVYATLQQDPTSMVAADINGDGIADLAISGNFSNETAVLFGNSDGSFKAALRPAYVGYGMKAADLDYDGKIDLVESFTNYVQFLHGNGDGTFSRALSVGITGADLDIALGDANGDGFIDIVGTRFNNPGNAYVLLSNGDGTFSAMKTIGSAALVSPYVIASGDFNEDGVADFVSTSNSLLNLYMGDRSGTIGYSTMAAAANISYAIIIADFDRDGVTDIATNDVTGTTLTLIHGNSDISDSQQYYSLMTQDSARSAMDLLADTHDRISSERSVIGASMARLETAVSNSSALQSSYAAAEARIMDADVAETAAELARSNILRQVQTSLLGQANGEPQLLLSLIESAKTS